MSKSRDSVEDLRTIDTVTATANAALARSGGTMTGDTAHGDNVKSKYGTGNDLQIYHTGSHSFVDDAGTGNLYIRSNSIVLGKYTGEYGLSVTADGSTDLYYDNALKLATTATGITVTGVVAATTLTGDGSALTGIDALPSQTGHAGKYLTTDATNASWAVLDTDSNTTTKALYEMSNVIAADYTIVSGNNAFTAGPITINPGISITLPSGSTWVIA